MIDINRLQNEFEKISLRKRGNGKTLHIIVRALMETDLDNNVLIFHNNNFAYTNWLLKYICKIAEELKYKFIIVNQNTIKLDNKKIIKVEKIKEDNKRGHNYNNWVVLYDFF